MQQALVCILGLALILASVFGLAGIVARSVVCDAPGRGSHFAMRSPSIIILGFCAVLMYFIGAMALLDRMLDFVEKKIPPARYELIREPAYRRVR